MTETTQQIRTIIQKNPGVNLGRIVELLEQKISIVEQGLSDLQKKGDIIVSFEDGYVRYYVKNEQQTNKEINILNTRRKIYDLIKNNPGLHLSKIAEILHMNVSLAEYHLTEMINKKEITSVKGIGGYYKRFYMKDSDIGIKEARILALLRQKSLLQIILTLWKNPNLQHKDIFEKLDISKSTLSYHIDKLVEYGLVEKISYGDDKGYHLKNEHEIIWLIRRYKLDRTLDRFKDLWNDIEL